MSIQINRIITQAIIDLQGALELLDHDNKREAVDLIETAVENLGYIKTHLLKQ